MYTRCSTCAKCDDILTCLQSTLRRITHYRLKYALLRCATTISILLELNKLNCYSESCDITRMYIEDLHSTLAKSPPRIMAPKTVMDRQAIQYIRLTSLSNCYHFRCIHTHICSIPNDALSCYIKQHLTRGFFDTMQPTLAYALWSRK
jgi:hypothetical protein